MCRGESKGTFCATGDGDTFGCTMWHSDELKPQTSTDQARLRNRSSKGQAGARCTRSSEHSRKSWSTEEA